ncbi:glycosyltransferase family 4 protein [Flectobacillus major]|uniref:glycosyltransferase family 4 protein n=1 Tax=Flectobacillus major TaxID=103 RepID=UPI0003FC20B4|nr:glycosyltransferase family 4 protein [Flectobacillus major]
MKQKILFVGHDANRAGAQILLLRFLKLLKEKTQIEFSVLLKYGGPLVDDYRAIAETFVLYQAPSTSLKRILLEKVKQKILGKANNTGPLWNTLKAKQFDLIVSNTFTNGDIFPELTQLGCPIYSYIHELEMGINMYSSAKNIQNTLNGTHRYIACADSVKGNLINQFGIQPNKIDVLPSLLPEAAMNYKPDVSQIASIKKQLGIPEQAFVVGGMGTIDLRKGVDLFLQIGHLLQAHGVYLVWVGGSHQQADFQLFNIDKKRLKLDNLKFVEAVANPLDYMALFDIFALTSREDPYPLVVLEAALLSKPIICFDQAGGAKDFVETNAGFLIDYLDVQAFAKQIEQLIQNTPERTEKGTNAHKKVLERHQTQYAFDTFLAILTQ